MRFTFDVEREEKIGFLMSNKRFRFDKKKSTRNKKIGWSDSLSVVCRHILMPLRSQRAETRKQLNQTSLWTYFFYIFLCSAKTKPMKTIVFVYFYWMFHSKKERKCNAVLRKQLAFVAYIENEEGKTRTLNPSMQRDATPKITKYLCRLYYTIYALIMSAQPISNWIVCVWKWLERVFFFLYALHILWIDFDCLNCVSLWFFLLLFRRIGFRFVRDVDHYCFACFYTWFEWDDSMKTSSWAFYMPRSENNGKKKQIYTNQFIAIWNWHRFFGMLPSS